MVVVVVMMPVVVWVVNLPHRNVLLVVVVFLGLGTETHGRFGVDVGTGCGGRRGHEYRETAGKSYGWAYAVSVSFANFKQPY